MLLTVTTTHQPATDLGYLLHKHPQKVQRFDQSFGAATVFFPEASAQRCTAALLLEIDPVGLVRRGRDGEQAPLEQYVNDRPYVASSFLAVALGEVFRTAIAGRCTERPELAQTPIPLQATVAVLPCRGGEGFLRALFEPLGYVVEATRLPLDPRFPEWGESAYFNVRLSATCRLSVLLTHLYVLIPVLDNDKHYWVGDAEVEKLLRHGGEWLAQHPLKEQITRRYLRHRHDLARKALDRLVVEEEAGDDAEEPATPSAQREAALEERVSLNAQRLRAVVDTLVREGASSVIDLGCGEGRLLSELLRNRQFRRVAGMDVSIRTLERAADRLKLDRMPPMQRERVQLLQGSLAYRDARLSGFDAATVVEVIEHLDPHRLQAFERVLFESVRAAVIVVTTPNVEYNVKFESLPAGQLRHGDHRFEWTRAQFAQWAQDQAARYGYAATFHPIGEVDDALGAPTQMAVFRAADGSARAEEAAA